MHMRADNNQEKRDLAGDYLRRARRKNILLAVLLLVLLVMAVWAACLGVAKLTPDRMIITWLPFFRGIFEGVMPLDAKEQNVLFMLRFPRMAAAVIAGAGLGIAGAGMQAITGNPMASPFTTGLSGRIRPDVWSGTYDPVWWFPIVDAKGSYRSGCFCHVCDLCHCRLYSGKLQTAPSRSTGADRYCFKLSV